MIASKLGAMTNISTQTKLCKVLNPIRVYKWKMKQRPTFVNYKTFHISYGKKGYKNITK